MFKNETNIEMKATTLFGLEDVLAKELMRMGARDIQPFKRGVSFTGDLGFLYKANLCLRTALRILVPLVAFRASNDKELYDEVKSMPWEKFLSEDDTLAVDAVLNSDNFDHSLYVEQKTKDAIVDRFREKTGRRPSVDLNKPFLKIYVHIFRDEVTIGLDSSGDLLYKRGYRDEINEAPIKENLAAGMVMLSDWQPHRPFIDGMCGSGTIAIEAALYANNIPPGYFRQEYGFMKWRNYKPELYETIYESSISRIKNDNPVILANDNNLETLEKARRNVQNAKVDDVITLNGQSFFDLLPEGKNGVLMLNPPYGERMNKGEVVRLYKEIGDKMKKDFKGYSAWIISSGMDAIKAIGLHPSRKITLYNGSLECKFLKFELYDGSKKLKKQGEAPDNL